MKILQAAGIAILVTFAFALITLGKNLLIPMVLALFIWYLINVLTDVIAGVRVRDKGLPQTPAFLLALVTIGGLLGVFINLISVSVNNVIRSAPRYQHNVDLLLDRVSGWLGLDQSPQLAELLHQIEFTQVVQELGFTLAGFIKSAGVILIYTLFIFLEQKYFLPKINRMAGEGPQQQKVRRILRRIYSDTKTYIGVKTLTSVCTGVVSYGVMAVAGLDFAIFWALLIFLFNYIPIIGSIVATFFPSVLALVQFPTLAPFIGVVIGLTATQVTIGNIIEPRLMGNTLNLSPLVILLSLALWGMLWGIPGAILCVPITVLMAIIFSNFESTRPVAILLSRDGELRTDV